jgi:hypothetical protein
MKGYRYSRSYNKYPDGYYPKLEYWNIVLKMAIKQQDTEAVVRAADKINYFANKQLEVDYLELRADSEIAIQKDSGEDWC